MVCFELLHAWGPPKRRFYSTWNSLYFPEIFSQRKLRIHAIRRGDGKHLTAKVCSNTCFTWEESRKYLNEIIFTRDGAVPRCLHGLVFIQQKVNILENESIRWKTTIGLISKSNFARAAHFFRTFLCRCFARLQRETSRNFLVTRFMEERSYVFPFTFFHSRSFSPCNGGR